MYDLPDTIESMERAAEARYEEATRGLPVGKMRCGCGRIVDEKDMVSFSDNPYAMPICGICAQEAGVP